MIKKWRWRQLGIARFLWGFEIPARAFLRTKRVADSKPFKIVHIQVILIGNPKSACLHFYTAKTQAALALPSLPYSTLWVE